MHDRTPLPARLRRVAAIIDDMDEGWRFADWGEMVEEAAERIERLEAALADIARQPEGDEQSAQAVAREALRYG